MSDFIVLLQLIGEGIHIVMLNASQIGALLVLLSERIFSERK